MYKETKIIQTFLHMYESIGQYVGYTYSSPDWEVGTYNEASIKTKEVHPGI